MEEKVKAFLELATQKKASDIFIIAGRPLSVKIDGKLCTLDGFEERLMPPETDEFIRIIYKLAHDRNIEPMLETGDDDFSMAIPGLSRFRVNTYRQRGSLAAVIRIIAFNLPDPQDLHIPPAVMEAADLTKGMVLITGPAGSGKSTTMACIIDKINHSREGHIITLEDPLEYLHRHDKCIVSQREICTDTANYLVSLRATLRQSPDVILLGEMRDRTFKPHDAFSVGEVFNAKDEELPDFIGNNGYFSSMFDFNETIFGGSEKGWYDCKEITPDDYKRCCFETQAKMGDFGFVSNIIENHDEPRGVSHYIPEGDCCDTSKKMLAALNFMLRGLPFIYQGQELGMENIPFKSIDEVDDISTLDEYKVALDAGLTPEAALKAVARRSRDNARTPMQWTGEENAGFTAGTPWLRVNSNYTAINVEKETIDPNSVLNFYKKLIALRKDPEYKETVVYGALEPFMEDRHNLMAYYRKGDKTLLVVGNYQWEEQEITLPSECKKVLINNYPDMVLDGNSVKLHGYQVLVVELA